MAAELTTLALDTSGARLSVGIKHAGEFYYYQSALANSHDEELANAIRNTLIQAGIRAIDLQRIVIAKGPGSFTGLRIGYAFAQGIAQSSSIPVVEVSSLLAAAYAENLEWRRYFVVGDARRSELFFASYLRNGARIEEIVAPTIIPVTALHDRVNAGSADESVLIQRDSIPLPQTLGSFVTIKEGRALVLGLFKALDNLVVSNSDQSAIKLSRLEPQYLRAVAAKTIVERQAEKR